MALRLINSSAMSARRGASAEALAERAGALLSAGDLAGHRSLFADAAAIEDDQRRYRARIALVEASFAACDTVRNDVAVLVLHAIAEETVALLEAEPREPVMLNLAGVALYELGALAPARDLFRAALGLDPALPHAQTNLDEAGARLRAGWKPPLPARVATTLRLLGQRAGACAARAKPAQGLTLSLCMIVRDEEAMLGRCLEAVRDAVDEIVIVDTGSQDATIEIARSFGAKVIEREWTGSFSEARNASFEAATGDWLLYLDADEILVGEDVARLRAVTGRTWREAFYLAETSYVGSEEHGEGVAHNALRVFRNRPHYRFEGRIHEQIAHSLPLFVPERIEATTIRVEHFGYLGVVRDAKQKSKRNVELLQRQREEGGDTPFLSFNIGSEHATLGDQEAARAEFAVAWEGMRNAPGIHTIGFAPTLISRYVRSLRLTGRLAPAREAAQEGLALFPGFTDLVLEQAWAAEAAGDPAQTAALLQRCIEMGDAPAQYTATIGAGTYLPLLSLARLRRAQGDLEDAEGLLDRALTGHPRFIAAVEPFVQTLLQRGAQPADVVDRVAAAIGELDPAVCFLLGIALYEAGHAVDAEEQFRAVLRRQPNADAARVALAEALLSQARFADTVASAHVVQADSPCAAPARRAELFARVMTADVDGARSMLAGEAGAALAADERAFYGAWCDVLTDPGAARPRLSTESVATLAVVLEALLRIAEVDAVPALLDLLDASELSWRGQRELLAVIYLRRGYLQSAADEWIAVCQEGEPDALALIGLAQTALARNLPEEAVLFARGAQEIEPGHVGAQRVLARLDGLAPMAT